MSESPDLDLKKSDPLSIEKTVSNQSSTSVDSSTTSRKRNPVDFEFKHLLGEGSFSTVMLAVDNETNKMFAVKILDKFHIIKEKKVKYVTIEKNVLHLLRHHFIVRLYYTFQDSTSLYFVLELCPNGDILGLLKRSGRFSREGAIFYISELIEAVKYIHSRGILHRDLKPDNILLDENYHIKVADFGSAKILENDENTDSGLSRHNSFVGTAEFCSPELLKHQGTTPSSDIWAIGCILYQFLVGSLPFRGGSEYLTFQKILELDYVIPEEMDQDLVELIKSILVIEDRPTLSEIQQNSVFRSIDWDNLQNMEPPKMENMKPLIQIEEMVSDTDESENMERIEDDPQSNLGERRLSEDPEGCMSPTMGISAESVDDAVPCEKLPPWIPLIKEPQKLVKYTILKKKTLFFPKPRGLALTNCSLMVFNIKNNQLTESYSLQDIEVQECGDSFISLKMNNKTETLEAPDLNGFHWAKCILEQKELFIKNLTILPSPIINIIQP